MMLLFSPLSSVCPYLFSIVSIQRIKAQYFKNMQTRYHSLSLSLYKRIERNGICIFIRTSREILFHEYFNRTIKEILVYLSFTIKREEEKEEEITKSREITSPIVIVSWPFFN